MSVVRLADKVDHVGFDEVPDTLARAMSVAQVGTEQDTTFRASHAVVLLLDDSNGQYHLKRLCTGLRTSELIALLRVAEHRELVSMFEIGKE